MTRLASPLPVRAAALAALFCVAGPAVAQETTTDPTAEEIAITEPEAAALATAYLNSGFFGLPLPADFVTINGVVTGAAEASHLAEVSYAGLATLPDTVFEVLIFDKSSNAQKEFKDLSDPRMADLTHTAYEDSWIAEGEPSTTIRCWHPRLTLLLTDLDVTCTSFQSGSDYNIQTRLGARAAPSLEEIAALLRQSHDMMRVAWYTANSL